MNDRTETRDYAKKEREITVGDRSFCPHIDYEVVYKNK